MRRSPEERVRTRRRLQLDGELIPIEQAAELIGEPVPRVMRLAIAGIGGVRLDAIPRGTGWWSSVPAVCRALQEIAARDAARVEHDAPAPGG